MRDLTPNFQTPFNPSTPFPSSPGVYLMKDAQGRIIYVGKALNLKKRLANYLHNQDDRYQVSFLMKRVAAIDSIITENEKEALLLENNLIKKHRPRYNIQLRDDKSYVSLKLTLQDKFPRLYRTRSLRKDGSIYFGPYTSGQAARETEEFLEKYFRLRTCSDAEFRNRSRPCLQYQIHRCDAPCVGFISEDDYRKLADQVRFFLQGRKQDLLKMLQADMTALAEKEDFEKAATLRDLIASIQETLEKQNVDRTRWIDQDVIGCYREDSRMTFCVLMIREGKVWESKIFHLTGHEENSEVLESFLNQYYGTAHVGLPDEVMIDQQLPTRSLLQQIFSEKKGKKVRILVPQRGDRMDLLKLAFRNAQEGFQHRSQKTQEEKEILSHLQKILGLQNFPRRIECFDISHLSGTHTVGSLVCFVDGLPFKEGYRRFKIKSIQGPDDFASLKEMLRRRLVRAQSEDFDTRWEKPDLMVIDGGKGQLSSVQAVIEELNITGIDLISLAKEKEGEDQDKVFIPGRKNPILLGRHSGPLHLLMRLRDEAHRFAITYHRKLRGKLRGKL